MTRSFIWTRSRGYSLLATLVAVGWAAPAAAQVSNATLAESLFREGKRLSGERKFAEACPKFAESYKLDPGLGTLLNLATCHESEGKTASAWAEFSDASARAKREADNDRAQLADEHVHALEAKLAYFTLGMAPGGSVPGLVIKFDTREVSTVALGVKIPVDPGKHQIEVSAPGKESDTQTVDAPPPGGTVAITLPVLRDGPAGAPATTNAPPASAGAAPAAPASPPEASSSSHTGVIVSGIATGAFLAGTVLTGVLYSGKRTDFNTANSDMDPSRFDKRDEAATLGTINLVFAGGTLVSAGLLTYFLVTGSSSEKPPSASARLRVLPVIAPNVGGITLQGAL